MWRQTDNNTATARKSTDPKILRNVERHNFVAQQGNVKIPTMIDATRFR